MQLVVGLGNPGRKYAGTRHNVGFDVVLRLAERWSLPGERESMNAMVTDGLVSNERAVLCRPQSFMNRSGLPARKLADFYKLDEDKVIVVHDDLDLTFGTVKVKSGGGHGGHNGLRDLNKHVGSGYTRIRVGLGRPPQGWDPADFVLGKWTSDETVELPSVVDRACDAAEATLRDGVTVAMNRFNGGPASSSNSQNASLEQTK